MRLPGADNVVAGRIAVDNLPNHLHVLGRIPPVPLGLEVPDDEVLLLACPDPGDGARNLPRNEYLPFLGDS